ncbi:MAG TPA: sulfurtransferase-like selenium metabolism protein YedF [Clostridiales bacterium]|nr:sulfurtransferase-like selenium metabolism protein YedF [Clostridiales bacterium]
MQIDARGKACPMPVILAKKELDGGCNDLTVLVDNRTAVENLTRLGNSAGMTVASGETLDGQFVRLTGEAKPVEHPVISCPTTGNGYAVFIGKDVVGTGERELGYNLMKMALYTLAQGDSVPAHILFMNEGVKLPAGEEQQVIDSLITLSEKGCIVLVCGTCLNYYGIADRLKVGIVSNMYDILGAMQRADKVISL